RAPLCRAPPRVFEPGPELVAAALLSDGERRSRRYGVEAGDVREAGIVDERADGPIGMREDRDCPAVLEEAQIDRPSVRGHVCAVRLAPVEELQARVAEHAPQARLRLLLRGRLGDA